jgi:uncharacterized protein YbbC (DUF1343 family)
MLQIALSIVLNGIDVLEASQFKALDGLSVGLITNHTGRTADGRMTVDVFHESEHVKLTALFAPEHGIRGAVDASVGDEIDEKTGLLVNSLYNLEKEGTARYKPDPKLLEGLDVLVFDIQDIGARFYTYIGTMGHAMEAAAEAGLKFMVLDRPNPINGLQVGGPPADPTYKTNTAFFPLATRHGMTVGEVAMLYQTEMNIDVDLEVIWCEGWNRSMWFDEIGQTWVNPSPNMRNLTQATIYPGICFIEATNVSVGRGTDTPFEHIGAPYIDGRKLAEVMNSKLLPGITFYPVSFTPDSSKFDGELCHGISMLVTDRDSLEPCRVGAELAHSLHKLYPEWEEEKLLRLVQNKEAADLILTKGYAAARAGWDDELAEFMDIRAKYLHYPNH